MKQGWVCVFALWFAIGFSGSVALGGESGDQDARNVGSLPVDPALRARLYPDWCASSLTRPPDVLAIATTVAVGQSIQNAIDSTASGVVELAPGVHTIAQTIRLRSGVVLRGAEEGSTIQTSQAMVNMVTLAGGYNGRENTTLALANRFSREVTFIGDRMTPGFWLIGGSSRGQLVRVLRVTGNRAYLETALADDFAGTPAVTQRDLITRAGLERLTLSPLHDVSDLILVRSAYDSWVRQVVTLGRRGQIRSAILLRQAYRVAVLDCTFLNAKEHGDGGQGYGIDLVNNSSNCLIEGNTLRLLRHSILIQEGASANVIRNNDSADPRHTNFVDGGPADISFHSYASANLVIGNFIDRIQINDAGNPGPHNTLAFNTLRSGPLTLANGVDHLTLLGNRMTGDVATLRARIMPSLINECSAESPSPGRPFWSADYDPFEGPTGISGFTNRGVGILDWGSGEDIWLDEDIQPDTINFCTLLDEQRP